MKNNKKGFGKITKYLIVIPFLISDKQYLIQKIILADLNDQVIEKLKIAINHNLNAICDVLGD